MRIPPELHGGLVAAGLAFAGVAEAAPRIDARDAQVVIDPATGHVETRVRIAVQRDTGGPVALAMDARLDVSSATLDDAAVTVERSDGPPGRSVWTLAVPSAPTDTATIVLRCSGTLAPTTGTSASVTRDGAAFPAASAWLPEGPTPSPVSLAVEVRQSPGWEATILGAGAGPVMGVTLVAGPWTTAESDDGGSRLVARASDRATASRLLAAASRVVAEAARRTGRPRPARFEVLESAAAAGLALTDAAALAPSDAAAVATGAADGVLLRAVLRGAWGEAADEPDAAAPWSAAFAEYLSVEPADLAAARRAWTARLSLGDDPTARGAMFVHSLAKDVGREAFARALAAPVRRNRPRTWKDWQTAFESAASRDLSFAFAQGASAGPVPAIELADVRVRTDSGRITVSGTVSQRLAEGRRAWRTSVRIDVEHLQGTDSHIVDLGGADTYFSFAVPSVPLRIEADPEFETLRRIAPEDVAPSIAAALARPRVAIVHPDGDAALAERLRAAAGGSVRLVPASGAPDAPSPGTSWIVIGDANVRMIAAARRTRPSSFPAAAADPATAVVLTATRSAADAAEFVVTIAGTPDALRTSGARATSRIAASRVRVDATGVEETFGPESFRTVRTLLPDLRAAASPERAAAAVAKLCEAPLRDRVAGGQGELAALRWATDELRLAGVDASLRPFTFRVRRHDPAAAVLTSADGAAVGGVRPVSASRETGDGGVRIVGAVPDDDPDVAGRAVVIDLGTGGTNPAGVIRETARLALARRAVAVFVRTPARPSPQMADVLSMPAPGATTDELRAASVAAVRCGATEEFALPVVAVPADFAADRGAVWRLDVRFDAAEIRSANVVGRLRAGTPRRAANRTVLVAARADRAADTTPGAGDSSAVAALVETAHVLASRTDLLSSDVAFAVFGAEDWGLRGSTAWTAPTDAPAGAAIVIGPVGTALEPLRVVPGGVARPGEHLVRTPHLAARACAAAAEQCALDAEFAPHARTWDATGAAWMLADRGTTTVLVECAPPADDAPSSIDPAKVARTARAVALSAIALAGGF